MKICATCVLPQSFPGIKFDTEGTCNYCRQFFGKGRNKAGSQEQYRKKFLNLLDDIRGGDSYRDRPYDAIMAYSGGKDSSSTLKLLSAEFKLKVLAVTFNHGFLSPQALTNINTVRRALDIDHLMVSPHPTALTRAFRNAIHADCFPPTALQRASAICNVCMNLIKSLVLIKAIEMAIPMISYGWSPGQIPIRSSVMGLNREMVQKNQWAIAHCIQKIMGNDARPFLLQKRHLEILSANRGNGDRHAFYNVSPLAFSDYDEDRIVEEIRGLGWKPPKDTDTNSTNCLLNAFAAKVHQERFGFHPYAFEIAGLVREGHMTREAGLKKLSTPPDSRMVEWVAKHLGVDVP